jgi:hypothetical protein
MLYPTTTLDAAHYLTAKKRFSQTSFNGVNASVISAEDNPNLVQPTTETLQAFYLIPTLQPKIRTGMFGFGGLVTKVFEMATANRLGQILINKAENMVAKTFGIQLEEEGAKTAANTASKLDQKLYEMTLPKLTEFKSLLANSMIASNDIQADLITQWSVALTQNGRATLDGIYQNLQEEEEWFKSTIDRLTSLPEDFVHVGAGSNWTSLVKLLNTISHISKTAYQGNTVEAQEARSKADEAARLLRSMATHKKTSDLYRWWGNYGAAALLLRMGEVNRTADDIMEMEKHLSLGYQFYLNMKYEIPILFPNGSNTNPLVPLKQVISRWPTIQELATSRKEASKSEDEFNKSVQDVQTALSSFITSEQDYHANLTDDKLAKTHQKDTKTYLQKATAARLALIKHNKDLINVHINQMAERYDVDDLQAGFWARKFFEDERESYLPNRPSPARQQNPHSVKLYFQAIKSRLFYGAVYEALKEQLATVPTDKVDLVTQKTLATFEKATEEHSKLREFFEFAFIDKKAQRTIRYQQEQLKGLEQTFQKYQQAISTLQNATLSEQTGYYTLSQNVANANWDTVLLPVVISKSLLEDELKNYQLQLEAIIQKRMEKQQTVEQLLQQNATAQEALLQLQPVESIDLTTQTEQSIQIAQVLKALNYAAGILENPDIGLSAVEASAIDNGVTLLKLNELFGISTKLSEEQNQQLKQIEKGYGNYKQSVENLKFKFATLFQHHLAQILAIQSVETTNVYNQVAHFLSTTVTRNPDATELIQELEDKYLHDWKKSIGTLKQLEGLVNQNLNTTVQQGIDSFNEAPWRTNKTSNNS